MSEPLYPNIKVSLEGQDDNAFAIIGRVQKHMRMAGVEAKAIQSFTKEATSGDYDHLLQTVMKYVEVS